MPTAYLPPVARVEFPLAAKAALLFLASSLPTQFAAAQPSPAAAAANADMLSWMAHGLLTAVVGLTVLTCLVLLIAFTTSRRVDARPLAPGQEATPADAAATPLAPTATPPERMAA